MLRCARPKGDDSSLKDLRLLPLGIPWESMRAFHLVFVKFIQLLALKKAESRILNRPERQGGSLDRIKM